MSFLAALGAAVANGVGPAISTAGALYANRQNLKHQDYWNNYQVELSNTAHQREVADLEAAGLNPILSAGGSGSSTPSLRAATIDNPLSSFGTNAKAIGDSLTGKITAEVAQAKADASTAESYAARADELAAAELSEARARSEKAWDDVQVSDVAQEADRIDALARLEALQGNRPGEVDARVKDDKVYNDLVEQYRNEIKSGRYKSSLGRSVFQDVMSGASSASDIYSRTKGRPAGKVPRR